MDPLLDAALRPGEPGRAVRALGRFLPGVRATGEQIVELSDYWRAEAEAALASSDPLLVALGDSLAQGVGASRPELGYVGLLRQQLSTVHGCEVGVVNVSRSGAVIEDVVATQIPALTGQSARAVSPLLMVCTVGSNDLVRGASPRRLRSRMEALFAVAPPGLIVATMPSVGSITASLANRHVRQLARETGRPLADVGSALRSWRGRSANDRFHPNDRGYQVWAEAFGAHLPTQASGTTLPA